MDNITLQTSISAQVSSLTIALLNPIPLNTLGLVQCNYSNVLNKKSPVLIVYYHQHTLLASGATALSTKPVLQSRLLPSTHAQVFPGIQQCHRCGTNIPLTITYTKPDNTILQTGFSDPLWNITFCSIIDPKVGSSIDDDALDRDIEPLVQATHTIRLGDFD